MPPHRRGCLGGSGYLLAPKIDAIIIRTGARVDTGSGTLVPEIAYLPAEADVTSMGNDTLAAPARIGFSTMSSPSPEAGART